MSLDRVHFKASFFVNDINKTKVIVIGAGGTGSHVLKNLARMDYALVRLNKPGLEVILYDDDVVSEYNIGRSEFAYSDIGKYKAEILIRRINRFYGLDWEAKTKKYDEFRFISERIIITCVDTIKIRKEMLKSKNQRYTYWIDVGNMKNHGQIILMNLDNKAQPKNSGFETVSKLKNLIDIFPDYMKLKDDESIPSCSMFEALENQGLFINSLLAELTANLLMEFLLSDYITIQGYFLNMDTGTMVPIKV